MAAGDDSAASGRALNKVRGDAEPRAGPLTDGSPTADPSWRRDPAMAGTLATADGCICAPGYPPLHGDRLELVGERGTIVMDLDRVYLVGREDEAETVDLVGRYQECFDHAIAEFVHGIRDGTPFETDRLDNLETLRLMEEVYTAAGVEVR